MISMERDRADILAVHRDWWVANTNLDIPRMVKCFPAGPNYLMFNSNMHPYFGIEEKIKIWEYYRRGGLHLDGPPDVRIMKFEVIGDLGYIAHEFEVRTKVSADAQAMIDEVIALPPPGQTLVERGRATEVYKRDDGEGRRLWKMWHFHCSSLPPPDTQRPGFNDSADSRGELGWNPWSKPLSVVGPGLA